VLLEHSNAARSLTMLNGVLYALATQDKRFRVTASMLSSIDAKEGS
jgi:hypothetical protein